MVIYVFSLFFIFQNFQLLKKIDLHFVYDSLLLRLRNLLMLLWLTWMCLSRWYEPFSIIFYYVETICISLWNTMYYHDFSVDKGVHKTHNIDKQLNFKLAMWMVFYMYFKYVIFPAKIILKSPIFFAIYFDIKSKECIFTKWIMKSWDPMHSEKCGLSLDWFFTTPPIFYIALRESIQPALKGAKVFQRRSNSSFNHYKALFIF